MGKRTEVINTRVWELKFNFLPSKRYIANQKYLLLDNKLKIRRRKERLLLFNSTSRKLPKIWRSYLKERCEQHQHLKTEFSRLYVLLKEKSIDKETYERLKKLLEIGYEQKLMETRLKHGF